MRYWLQQSIRDIPSESRGSPVAKSSKHNHSARRFWSRHKICTLLLLATCGLLVAGLIFEIRTSWLQARLFSEWAGRLSFTLEEGPSDTIRYPLAGPFDERLGYTRLPTLLQTLDAKGMQVSKQTRFAPELLDFAGFGFNPPYREKTQAGLAIFDAQQQLIFRHRYPQRQYPSIEAVPPVVMNTLMFIEDRELLESIYSTHNPAIAWGRFSLAALYRVGELVHLDTPSIGGSTLATQIEKYRHSPQGITGTITDKLQQMVSASVRVYDQGADTQGARRKLVLDYLNTVPLSAAPGYGEVNGIGDGLAVWFNASFSDVNDLLSQPVATGEKLTQQGLALRQIVALTISHRRPSYYLVQDRAALAALTNSYLRLLTKNALIPEKLRDAALQQTLEFRDFLTQPAVIPTIYSKGVNVVRNRLQTLLQVPLYELDRMDLQVATTIELDLQDAVTLYLRELRNPEQAQAAGLFGQYLLKPGQEQHMRYSFTLYERTIAGNKVRVQTDNTSQPFDINEGSKLELGSTAKLRVLATYLDLVADIYQRHSGLSDEALSKAHDDANDILSKWTLAQLISQPGMTLDALLAAALERRFSANPHERFYTGGGLHVFNNYKREDNGRNPTLREALRESINLPFVRLLREVVKYHSAQKWSNLDAITRDDKDPRRQEVLTAFIDKESTLFLSRFWKKYYPLSFPERVATLLQVVKPYPLRLAVVHRYLYPHGDFATFEAFLAERVPQHGLSPKKLNDLYVNYGPDRYSLQDLAYLSRVHPLELWLLAYLEQTPNASLSDALQASQDIRQQVYGWLLRTRAKNARDSRIRIMLELEAFTSIHSRWKQWGYPFDHLIPSLGTALGSSGDRPAALADLMGIIVNGGARLPSVRIEELHFAENTPYETVVERKPVLPQRVMASEVAAALRGLLAEVIENGTGRRLKDVFILDDKTKVAVGGKTGTGDNQFTYIAPDGRRVLSPSSSRTATFVFYLGENYFGTVTTFVQGSGSTNLSFTSALPVQVLKSMAPLLMAHDVPQQVVFHREN